MQSQVGPQEPEALNLNFYTPSPSHCSLRPAGLHSELEVQAELDELEY